MINDGTLAFKRSNDYAFGGVISGTGAVNQLGAANLTLSANNSFSGGLNVNAGTVTAGATDRAFGTGLLTVAGGAAANLANFNTTVGGLAGAGAVTLGTATLTLDQAGTTIYSGTMSGTGGLVKDGAGTLTLSGPNSYSGGTTINAGTISVSADGNLGALAGTLTFGGGTLENTQAFTSARDVTLNAGGGTFKTDADLTLTGTIVGTGGLTAAGPQALILTANNSYVGGTTVATGGKLQLGNGGASGSIVGDVANSGTLAFNRSDPPYTFGGLISGDGAVTQMGPGTLVLTADNTYSGGTTISAGTLQVGDGGPSGSLGTGTILDNGALVFKRSGTLTVAGKISGSGTVEQAGSGTTVFTADNDYSGGTTISGGILQLGNGGNTGSFLGGVSVAMNAVLAFNRSDTFAFDNAITGAGGVTQQGSGTTIFNTAQTYTGPTTIDAGALVVNGSITSNTTVNPAGTLGGVGTVTGDVTNAGTLAPAFGLAMGSGTPGAKMTINGNYAGNGGNLAINSFLGKDNASSITDQLIVNDGAMTGSTAIKVTVDPTSPGSLTTGSGIPIVVAEGTTTTTPDAFKLNGTVKAGVLQYVLVQGTTPDHSWYLCSSTACVPANGGDTGGPFTQTLGPPPNPPAPLLRPEVPMHAVYGAMARQLGLLSLGTFHERNGDQQLADTGGRERGWARIFGQHMEQSHSGDARPSFDGNFVGLQGGVDLWQFASLPGHRDNVGMLAASAEGRARVSGLVLGVPDLLVGSTDFDATSIGAYWSHIARTGWYTDAVLMGTIYDGDGDTRDGSRVGVDGTGVIASLEGGFTLARFMGLKLEPQGQLVYQYINLDDAHDPVSEIAHRTPDALHGRIGLRLSADSLPWIVRPYLKANIWQDFAGSDRTIYDGVHEIVNRHRSTTLELGGGFVANIAPNVGLWASADWTTDIAGTEQEREGVRGTAGLRVVW